ncbi:MAG: hypothetical protein ACYC61_26760 [Isosphaeraceae bacterium]
MEQRKVDGIDAYGFPPDLVGHPLLAWMGEDYLRFVTTELLRKFAEQDPGTQMMIIKCEAPPRLSTEADLATGVVRDVAVEFDLTVLLRALSGRRWRLRGTSKFGASRLDQPQGHTITVGFDLRSAEEAR